MKSICLNLDSRPDRWKRAQKEFARLGLKVERFPAVHHESPHHSFIQSQKAILKSITEPTIVFEDDVKFVSLHAWESVLNSIPEDWELLYLGGNPQQELTQQENAHWWRALNVWTTHAVCYTPEGARKILAEFDDNVMYDNWLGSTGLYLVRGYICKPFLCTQRPDYSDIWKTQVNYQDIIEYGQNKLK